MADAEVTDKLSIVAPEDIREAAEEDGAAMATTVSDELEGSSDDEEESDAEPAAVLTRERRTNAGNRYSKLLAAEEKADEDAAEGEFYTAEGWQEQADDEAFSGSEAEAPDDVSLHSSSSDSEDDDDGADDQGEKDLKKQERAERAAKTKKRKTMQDVYKPRPKRPRIAVSAVATPADGTDGTITPTAKPKKKSERVSWIPAEGEGPQRQSSRKLAVENKVRVHERLEKAEKHRLRTLAIMQAADQRKAAVKAKEMTQEERLAEAMTIEKRNAKSLNRWEENERLKEEERKEKLAALKNRTLEGPFIRYWSGQGVWCAEKLRRVGKGANVQEIEERVNTKEQEKFRKQQERERLEREAAIQTTVDPTEEPAKPEEGALPAQPSEQAPSDQPQPPNTDSVVPDAKAATFLDGIHDWATQPGHSQQSEQSLKAPVTTRTPSPAPPATESQPPDTSINAAFPPLPPFSQAATPPPQPPPHYSATLAMATLIILESFPNLADPSYVYTAKSRAKDREERDRNTISRQLVGFEQPTKGTKYAISAPPELCEITSRPARYRDPLTGLAYADGKAFKSLRRLVAGGCEWSNLLGAFVGTGEMARGTPESVQRSVRAPAVV